MQELSKQQRFVVVGSSCAGKTTIGKAIAEILSVNLIELDNIHWCPNWSERPEAEFREIVSAKTDEESWVVDGCYSRIQELTLGRADVIVWLNYSFTRVFLRALSRTVSRVISRKEVFVGCRESLRITFLSTESILWWVITTWKRKRQQYRKLFDDKTHGDKWYVELREQKEADSFLEMIRRQQV